ncbi:hypothetical protein GF327_07010 [Candidatus Woesearchaeota archaeon]|nr:hypothetical protein [Candidatus Woesearchaeota archaeon]
METKFKYLPHTADAMFRSYGKGLNQAFENAALAMYNIITETKKIKPKKKKEIFVSAKRKESLLYDFLEEFLFLLDTQGFLLNKIEKLSIEKYKGKYNLKAEAYGDHYKNYEVSGNIKSITYNEMFIREKGDSVVIQAVVDL